MIDHVSIAVRDLAASAEFYQQLLEPLGLKRLVARDTTIGFGKTYPEFWLNARPGIGSVSDDTGNHICLRAPDRIAVDKFYEVAAAKGGRGDGSPRDRQATITTYYGAFVRDPDGNKIEAVTFPPKASS